MGCKISVKQNSSIVVYTPKKEKHKRLKKQETVQEVNSKQETEIKPAEKIEQTSMLDMGENK